MWLVQLAINRPVFMSMVELFLIVLGLIAYDKLGIDQFPKVDPPIVTITTEYPGAGPAEIEALVTKPIEEQVNEIGSIERLTSTSKEGVSQVVIEFKLEIDAQEIQVEVQDKVARIRPVLPRDAKEPLVQRLDFADKPILRVALHGSGQPESLLRRLADNMVKQHLQQVDGVGQIDVFGGEQREVRINLNRQALTLWKLSPATVADAVAISNRDIPAGEIVREPERPALRVLGMYRSVAEIADTIVEVLPGGNILRVRDLGEVQDSFRDRDTMARVNGLPVVLLEIKRQSGTNTVAVANGLKAKLPEINSLLPDGMSLAPVYDGAKVIKLAVRDVIESLLIASFLAILVVYLFLGSVQSTLITGLALPATIVATFFGLYLVGFTINTMTLLGLTLSVGLILDDAIVVRENVWRRIEEGEAPMHAAVEGTRQVYVALLATTATVLATFLPVTLIPGIVGRFLSAFALTVCVAIVFSTFDALTMAPMMSAHLTTQRIGPRPTPNALIRVLEAFGARYSAVYLRILSWSLRKPLRVLFASLAVFVAALFLPRIIGFTFLPNTEYGELDLSLEAPVGTSVTKTNEIVAAIDTQVRQMPEVEFTSAMVGNYLGQTNVGSLFIRLRPMGERNVSTTVVKRLLRERLATIQHRENLLLTVADAGGGGTGQRQVTATIQGPDLDRLLAISNKVVAATNAKVKQVVNLTTNLRPGRAEYRFKVDRARAAAFGLDGGTLGRAMRGLFEGELPSVYRAEGEEFDLRVRLRPEDRVGPSSIGTISIPNKQGSLVPLAAVAAANLGASPANIVRIDLQRSALLEGDLENGYPLAAALEGLGTIIKQELPASGYRFEFLGQARSMHDMITGMMIALSLGSVFIYMIMASLYESLILPLAILLTLPLAIVGAFVAVLLAGKFLDVYTVIGIIMLMGLVAKNAILLVDYVEQLRRETGLERVPALMLAGKRRLRPIMMTTVAMIAGMSPIACGLGELNKARAGMGIAAIGGLVSSTMLSLVVVPCAYIYLDRLRVFTQVRLQKFYRVKTARS